MVEFSKIFPYIYLCTYVHKETGCRNQISLALPLELKLPHN